MNYRNLDMALIKPTGSHCNLRCDYCFYLDKGELYDGAVSKHHMNEDTLENLIIQLFKYSNAPLFAWQGGEPTLMGLDFFKKAVELQQKHSNGKPVQNTIQTNGLLLNEDWADFLRDNNFLVGLSLDGPAHIHDKYRPDMGGNPTHSRIEANAKMLISRGVEVNVLSTIDSYSVNYPNELYQYYKDLGLTFMQFIPIVETDKDDPTKAAPFSVDPEEFGKFLCTTFDLWYNDIEMKHIKQTTSIRFIDSVFHRYVGKDIPDCVLQKECGNYLVVEHNGDCYSCDFFVEPKNLLGNLNKNDMFEMLNSGQQKQFGRIKTKHKPKCLKCKWYKLCFGGCPKDRVRDPQDFNHNRFCEAYKMYFEHAHDRYAQLAEMYLNLYNN